MRNLVTTHICNVYFYDNEHNLETIEIKSSQKSSRSQYSLLIAQETFNGLRTYLEINNSLVTRQFWNVFYVRKVNSYYSGKSLHWFWAILPFKTVANTILTKNAWLPSTAAQWWKVFLILYGNRKLFSWAPISDFILITQGNCIQSLALLSALSRSGSNFALSDQTTSLGTMSANHKMETQRPGQSTGEKPCGCLMLHRRTKGLRVREMLHDATDGFRIPDVCLNRLWNPLWSSLEVKIHEIPRAAHSQK